MSSKGYLYSGVLAPGQSNAGKSTLCNFVDLVVDNAPNNLPWKALSKLRIANFGVPGS